MSVLAEKSIIGYLLMDSSKMSMSINKIKHEMFSVLMYADIYDEFETGFVDNTEVNAVTVQSALLDKGYRESEINECLTAAVSDLDIQTSYKSCIDIIINDYKCKVYGEKIKGRLPKTSEVDDAIRKTINDLECLLDESTDEIKSISEIAKKNKDKYFKDGVEKNKVFIGIKSIDKMLGGIEGGDVAVLAARPAVGKSAMALQIIEHNANLGKKVGYFNLEMQENQLYERMISRASGIEMARIRNATRFLNDEEEKYNQGNEKLLGMDNIFIRSGSARVNDVRSAAKNGNFDLIVIDYLQLLRPDKSRGANRYAEVGDISRGVKAIAMDYDVPIIALSQLNRASEGKETKEPTMSELRESGDIEQDASIILMLWNSDKDDKSRKKFKIDKARQGKLGTEDLVFNGATMTFIESSPDFNDLSEEDNPFT